jgi:hypothetical protein
MLTAAATKTKPIGNCDDCRFTIIVNSISMAAPIGLPPKMAEFCHTSNRSLLGHQCHCALLRLFFNSSATGRSVGNKGCQALGGSLQKDKVHYPGEVGTPTADLTLVKMHFNSVISTWGAQYMTLDVKNFYLKRPMVRYEYVCIRINDIPEEIIVEYNLHKKVTKDGYVYVKIQKGMYGLPQAGILAQELLEKQLNKHEYSQSKSGSGPTDS